VHVPFKGIPEALSEALTGRVQFFMAPIANSVSHVREGRLAGLGVSSLKRDPLLPAVPTVDEAGVPGYESELWFGVLGPAGLPAAVRTKLNREITRVLSDAETRGRWSAIGIEPRPTQPAEFDDLIRREIALYSRIARAAQIRAD
jgi:tripartite-type tricarboxylate transporter receptor subunit TctC